MVSFKQFHVSEIWVTGFSNYDMLQQNFPSPFEGKDLDNILVHCDWYFCSSAENVHKKSCRMWNMQSWTRKTQKKKHISNNQHSLKDYDYIPWNNPSHKLLHLHAFPPNVQRAKPHHGIHLQTIFNRQWEQ